MYPTGVRMVPYLHPREGVLYSLLTFKSFFQFFVSLFSDICKHCKLANKIACNIFSAQHLKFYSFHIKYTQRDWTICSSGFKGEFLFTNLRKTEEKNEIIILFSGRKRFYSQLFWTMPCLQWISLMPRTMKFLPLVVGTKVNATKSFSC